MYSRTEGLASRYRPFIEKDTLVPCSFSGWIPSSLGSCNSSFQMKSSFLSTFPRLFRVSNFIVILVARCSLEIRVEIIAERPVVNWPYIIAAEIPIPCCPLDCFPLPNLDPYNSLPKTLGTFSSIIPGPLSSIDRLNSSFP